MGKMYSRVCKKNNTDYPVNVEYYNSANDVVDDLMTRKLKSGGWHEPKEDPDWTGCKNFDEALEFLRTGYYPVVEKLEREFKIANQQTCDGKRITFKNNILGYNPIVPLAMMGVPNSMIDMTMKPIKTKVVDIYYDMTANCGVSSDDIIEAGLSVLSVICDLERQGYRFNLFAVQTYCDEDDCDTLIVKIKDAKQPIDLRRMSFPLCHTGFFRLIGFDWYGKNPHSRYRSCYGHEISREFRGKALKHFTKTVFGDTAIFLRCDKLVRLDKEEKKTYLKEVLTNVGKGNNED